MSSNGNKYARQANRPREAAIALDESLTRLEEDIRRLKIEYDIYFNNGSRRPPHDTKARVETVVKRMADDRAFSFAQRYRYNSLVARYTSMRELWRRTIQEREEGRDAQALARAAREVEKQVIPPKTFSCDDANKNTEAVRAIYEALVEAKKSCGEVVEDFTFPRFHRMIAAKTDALKSKLSCESVQFAISVENNQVVFKAKAG